MIWILAARWTAVLTAVLLASNVIAFAECSPPPQLQVKLHAHPSAETYAAVGQYFGDNDQHAPSGNHWIKVRLEGVKSNRSAIGARVVVRYGGKVQVQEVLSQASYLSSNDPRLHFGLGAAMTADIQVRWPLGLTENFRAVAANQLITIREGQGIVKGRPFR